MSTHLTEINLEAVRNIKRAVKDYSKRLEEECGVSVRVGKRKDFGKKGNSYSILLSFYPYTTCGHCGKRMASSLKGANGKRYCGKSCKGKAYRMRGEQRNEAVCQENKVLREENKRLRALTHDQENLEGSTQPQTLGE